MQPPQPAAPTDARKVFQVSELARLIKAAIENEFGNVWVEGEISNMRRPTSGHLYFTLKDSEAQLAAVLFRGNQIGLKLELRDGLKIRAYGQITAYEKSGQCQIVVRRVEEAGKGSLQEQFEALKKKLAAEGLFAEERKKKLPLLPQHIGIVTSPSGAAIRDILNILNRRFPNLHILIAPVRVQGDGAAQEIAAAIDLLNARGGLDVLIVGRGGGSLEDLWCFNEEVVARAIARSQIPVISAVGHEIDCTISDFVADLRAPTPSSAAELLVGSKEAFEQQVQRGGVRLARALKTQTLVLRNRLTTAAGSYVFREPQNLIRRSRDRLDTLRAAMASELRSTAQQRSQQVDELGLRMGHQIEMRRNACRQSLQDANPRMARALRATSQRTALHTQELLLRLGHGMTTARNAAAQDLRRIASQLKALSPLAVLERGFSLTRTADGKIIRDAAEAPVGTTLQTRLAHGSLESQVTLSKKET
ncbi:MAG: exodeoxyribonuclease VII large subunit [Kiritimatiellaeota bacterium]|nr:exodeoxyribonuclease VII large subunit [Kiritimatiellota bacterium]